MDSHTWYFSDKVLEQIFYGILKEPNHLPIWIWNHLFQSGFGTGNVFWMETSWVTLVRNLFQELAGKCLLDLSVLLFEITNCGVLLDHHKGMGDPEGSAVGGMLLFFSMADGVHQHSILSPMLFKMLGEVIWRFGLWSHLYADDTQLYFSFISDHREAVQILKHCQLGRTGWGRANWKTVWHYNRVDIKETYKRLT